MLHADHFEQLHSQSQCHHREFFLTMPWHVKAFIIWKDSKGKTRVHVLECPDLGKKGKGVCDCPTRLATSTVAGCVSSLSSVFELAGWGKVWNESAEQQSCRVFGC